MGLSNVLPFEGAAAAVKGLFSAEKNNADASSGSSGFLAFLQNHASGETGKVAGTGFDRPAGLTGRVDAGALDPDGRIAGLFGPGGLTLPANAIVQKGVGVPDGDFKALALARGPGGAGPQIAPPLDGALPIAGDNAENGARLFGQSGSAFDRYLANSSVANSSVANSSAANAAAGSANAAATGAADAAQQGRPAPPPFALALAQSPVDGQANITLPAGILEEATAQAPRFGGGFGPTGAETGMDPRLAGQVQNGAAGVNGVGKSARPTKGAAEAGIADLARVGSTTDAAPDEFVGRLSATEGADVAAGPRGARTADAGTPGLAAGSATGTARTALQNAVSPAAQKFAAAIGAGKAEPVAIPDGAAAISSEGAIAKTETGFATLSPQGASEPGAARSLSPAIVSTANAIARGASQNENKFTIRLDPPELGRVDVRLKIGDDGIARAHLIVERSETLDLFLRDQRSLERQLEQAGVKTDGNSLQFSLEGGDQQSRFAQSDRDGSGDGRPAGEQSEPGAEDTAIAAASRAHDGRLNITI